jgi:hypothetical protein
VEMAVRELHLQLPVQALLVAVAGVAVDTQALAQEEQAAVAMGELLVQQGQQILAVAVGVLMDLLALKLAAQAALALSLSKYLTT